MVQAEFYPSAAVAKARAKAKLSVDPEWQCQQSGDCCRMPESVILRQEERKVLQAYAEKHLPIKTLNKVNFVAGPEPGFDALLARPCPFYDIEARTCLVYEVRPYNCRRFACMRPDIKSEHLVLMPHDPRMLLSEVGCVNTRTRLLESRVARRLFEQIQRKAQRWARKHGWTDAAG